MERLSRREGNIDDAYAQPANFLEIEVCDPMTHGAGSGRFTEYTVITRTNLPVHSAPTGVKTGHMLLEVKNHPKWTEIISGIISTSF